MADRRRVVVVGGGLAGLASAVWLAERGDQVTLLESRGRLGGRTIGISLDVAGHQEDLENGQHVIAAPYDHVFRYLRSVGTSHLVEFPGSFGIRTGTGAAISLGMRPRDGIRLLRGFDDLSGLDLLRSGAAVARMLRDVTRLPDELDQITVEQWWDRVGLPESARRVIWRMMTLGVLNERSDLASAHALAALMRTGLRKSRRHGRRAAIIGYPTVDLRTLYIEGAERVFAERGVDVRLRAKAAAVEVREGRATGVRLADGEVVDADAVIVAVPAWSVAPLLAQVPGAEAITAAAERLVPIPIMSVYVHFDRPIGMDNAWETLLDGDVGWVFDRTRMQGRSSAGWLYALTTCASYELMELRHDEVVERCLASVRAAYPAACEAKVINAHTVPWRRATFSSRPGVSTIRPPQRTAVEGLALAGDWTRNNWPTTMEGAVESASFAIEALEDVGPRVEQPARG